jgi:hypothetical protein
MQLLICRCEFLSSVVKFATFAGSVKVAFQGSRRRSIEGVIEPSGGILLCCFFIPVTSCCVVICQVCIMRSGT